jgi:hypothetical protein
MSLKLYASQAIDYTPASEGTHIARCLRVIDLGTQDTEYQGKQMERPQVILQFVLLDEEIANPVVTKRYTASLHPQSGLRKDLEAWVGKINLEFSLSSLLNKPCLVSISHNQKDNRVYANVSGVSSVPKGFDVPELPPQYQPLIFDLSKPDRAVFELLPVRMRGDILRSKEARTNQELYDFLTAPKVVAEKHEEVIPETEIPF